MACLVRNNSFYVDWIVCYFAFGIETIDIAENLNLEKNLMDVKDLSWKLLHLFTYFTQKITFIALVDSVTEKANYRPVLETTCLN